MKPVPVQIMLDGGLVEDTDKRLLSGKMLTVSNYSRSTATGALARGSWKKRRGCTFVDWSAAAANFAGAALWSFRGAPVAFGDSDYAGATGPKVPALLTKYDDSSAALLYRKAAGRMTGRYVEANTWVYGSGVLATDVGVSAAYNSGTVAITTSNGRLQFVDYASGRSFNLGTSGGALGAGTTNYVVSVGADGFMVFDTSGNNLRATKYSVAGAVVAGPTNVVTDLNAAGAAFDVFVRPDTGRVLIGYYSTTPNTKAVEWNPTTMAVSIAATVISAGDGALMACGWAQMSALTRNVVYLGVAGATAGARYHSINATTLALNGSTTLDAADTTNVRNITGIADERSAATTVEFCHSKTGASPQLYTIKGTSVVSVRSASMVSKPWFSNNKWYCTIAYESTAGLQNTMWSVLFSDLFTLSFPSSLIAGRHLSTVCGGHSTSTHVLGQVGRVDANNHVVGCARRTAVSNVGGTYLFTSKAGFLKMREGVNGFSTPFEYADALQIAGGSHAIHAGMSQSAPMPEANPQLYPEAATLAQAAAGSLTLLGTYGYICVYRWRDPATGRMVQSEPSTPASFTLTGANATINVTWKTIGVTALRNAGVTGAIKVAIFRTAANGSLYTLLSERDNDTSVDTVLYADTASDASIASAEPLYTSGGVLPNQPAPGTNALEAHNGRLWCISAEDPLEVWFSKSTSPGEAPGWNANLKIRIDGDGDAYALASMDDKLIVFKKNAIYALYGDGPDVRGQGALPSISRIVTGGIGSTTPRLIARTPLGIVFIDNDTNIPCLLTRALEVQEIGRAAAASLAAVTCVDIVHAQSESRVYFVSSTTTWGVWDYLNNEWSTYTSTERDTAGCAQIGSSGTALAQRLAWLGPSGGAGGFNLEGTTITFDDNGAAYSGTLKVRVQAAGLRQEFRATDLLFTVANLAAGSAASLTVKLYADRSSTAFQTVSLDVNAIDAADGEAPVISVRPSRQRFETLDIEIIDASTSFGCTIAGITVMAAERTSARVPAANRMV